MFALSLSLRCGLCAPSSCGLTARNDLSPCLSAMLTFGPLSIFVYRSTTASPTCARRTKSLLSWSIACGLLHEKKIWAKMTCGTVPGARFVQFSDCGLFPGPRSGGSTYVSLSVLTYFFLAHTASTYCLSFSLSIFLLFLLYVYVFCFSSLLLYLDRRIGEPRKSWIFGLCHQSW